MNSQISTPQSIPWPALAAGPEADIVIIGLGPGELSEMSLGAWQALHQAGRVLLRTRRHPCVQALSQSVDLEDCDDLYESSRDFGEIYTEIARRVVSLGCQPGRMVYAVPGHPWVGEATTRLILAQAQEAGLAVQVVGGGSFVEASFGAVQVDCMDGSQVVDAMLLARQHYPEVDVGLPLLIGQLHARWLASDVKLVLLTAYPADHPVTLVRAAGTGQQATQAMPLHELDRRDAFDHLTTLYVPPLPEGSSFTHLQEIVAHLRAPDGCPWDREQTLESLRQDLLDETAEVLEAVDMDDDAHMAEELGDLLLVGTMMVQIASEEGRFQMADVTRRVVSKLIRRHPHVFGDVNVANMEELLSNWDAIKAQERAEQGQAPRGPLDGIPASLPALEKARAIQSKAEKMGLVQRTAIASERPQVAELLGEEPDESELGALLWQVVALAHGFDLNAEDALRSYAVRFRETHRADPSP